MQLAPRFPIVPEWPPAMRGGIRYRPPLDEPAPDAPRTPKPHRAA